MNRKGGTFMTTYGYVRVSTMQQNIERQKKAILDEFPDATIYTDEFTGKEMDRPEWSKLYKALKPGDVVVFDEVSRMSRNAEEGFRVYQELFEKGVQLIFLKERFIDTAVYSAGLKRADDIKTGKTYLDEGLKVILMGIAEEQIRIAFEQSQNELKFKQERTRGGITEAKKRNLKLMNEYPNSYKDQPGYSQIGREAGDKLNVKKAEPIKALIRQFSKDFDGNLNDIELLGVLNTKEIEIPIKKNSGETEMKKISAHISRNTLYKYKKEMKEG
jgi:DNA invertase Pin-like site-specific DNA recombinase